MRVEACLRFDAFFIEKVLESASMLEKSKILFWEEEQEKMLTLTQHFSLEKREREKCKCV